MTNNWKPTVDDAVRRCLDAPTGGDCRLIMREVPAQAWTAFARAFKAGLQAQGRMGGQAGLSPGDDAEPTAEADFSGQRSIVMGILLREEKERVLQVELRRRGAWPMVGTGVAKAT